MFVVWRRIHAGQPLWYWDEGQRHRRLYRQQPEATPVVVTPRPPPPRLARRSSTARPYTSKADRELFGLGTDFSPAELRAAYYRLVGSLPPGPPRGRRNDDEGNQRGLWPIATSDPYAACLTTLVRPGRRFFCSGRYAMLGAQAPARGFPVGVTDECVREVATFASQAGEPRHVTSSPAFTDGPRSSQPLAGPAHARAPAGVDAVAAGRRLAADDAGVAAVAVYAATFAAERVAADIVAIVAWCVGAVASAQAVTVAAVVGLTVVCLADVGPDWVGGNRKRSAHPGCRAAGARCAPADLARAQGHRHARPRAADAPAQALRRRAATWGSRGTLRAVGTSGSALLVAEPVVQTHRPRDAARSPARIRAASAVETRLGEGAAPADNAGAWDRAGRSVAAV